MIKRMTIVELSFGPNISLFAANLAGVLLDAAPWLLLGLFLAGLIKAWFPQDGVAGLLGGEGFRPIFNGALIGMPLPICSCGVLPLAVSLRCGGASRPATTSFLVSTPETGVDSIALSYGMLGPFVAVARPVAALFSAFTTGLLMTLLPPEEKAAAELSEAATDGCCPPSEEAAVQAAPLAGGGVSFLSRTGAGLRFAFIDIFDDIALWMVIGLVLAAATMTWVPPQTFVGVGGNIITMVVMVLIGIPMYICATASTPVAAALLAAGMSPGAAMVFMLAGPATNIATLGVVRREMGGRAVALYLIGIVGSTIAAGLATDAVAWALGIDVTLGIVAEVELLPRWLEIVCAVLFVLLMITPLSQRTREFRRGPSNRIGTYL